MPTSSFIDGEAHLYKWGVGGSYGVEDSRGCMRSCADFLERCGGMEQKFHGGPFIKRPRWLLDAEGKIAE